MTMTNAQKEDSGVVNHACANHFIPVHCPN